MTKSCVPLLYMTIFTFSITTESQYGQTADSQFAFAKHFGDNMVLQKAPYSAVIHGFSPDIGQKVILQVFNS